MKTPIHIWIVGIVALLWNAMGAFDYVMTQTNNAKYLAQFSPEELDYFNSFPSWVQATWAIAIWFGVIGSILILLRLKWAAPILGISFVSMVITFAQNHILADVKMHDVVGKEALYFSAVIFIVALLLWLYARKMVQAWHLR